MTGRTYAPTDIYWRTSTGRRWHIYDGDVRHDLGYPAMVMRCGITVDEVLGTASIGKPAERDICGRCKGMSPHG